MAAKEIKQVTDHLALLAKIRDRNNEIAAANNHFMREPKGKPGSPPEYSTRNGGIQSRKR